MHQHLRNAYPTGSTRYCPLDLYSEDDTSFARAFEGLWNEWTSTQGKGNNWKVSVDGKEISPDEVNILNDMRDIALTSIGAFHSNHDARRHLSDFRVIACR